MRYYRKPKRQFSPIVVAILLIICCYFVITFRDSPSHLTNSEVLATADAIRAQTPPAINAQTPIPIDSHSSETYQESRAEYIENQATAAKEAYIEISLTDGYLSHLEADFESTRTETALKEYYESQETDAIQWHEASLHVGESLIVCGPVVGTSYASTSTGAPTFINLGADYPSSDRFTIVIWDRDRAYFDSPPEDYYFGKTLCVTGTIILFRGIAQIEVSQPIQIEVY